MRQNQEKKYNGKKHVISGIKGFDISQTLECGQCFHFERLDDDEYGVVHRGELLRIKTKNNEIAFENASEEMFKEIWMPYFDLNRDYSKIKKNIELAEPRLKAAIIENDGMRILNQEFSETLMSFIISQNKQIPHIKKIVRDISEKYGTFLGEINGKSFYGFPEKEVLSQITIEDYKELKTGFRAPYLFDAASKMSDREDKSFCGEHLCEIGYEEAKKKLMEIKGVGEKVANCVLLFSLGYRFAFPVDVWIKRIMENMYFEGETDNKVIMEFAKEKFGEYGGYAQQYLFIHARNNNLGK